MPEITCPRCGRISEFVAIRRSAEEFCSHCDYPLFWAPSSIPATTPGANSDATLRRLPGAGGRHRVGTKVCPTCGELNPITETICLRCRNDLDPKPPEPEPAPPPPPAPAPPPPEPVEETGQPWWVWLVVALCVIAVIAALVIAL